LTPSRWLIVGELSIAVGEFAEVQQKRRRLLRAAYDLANGTPSKYVYQTDVMWRAGIQDKAEYMGIVAYHEAEGNVTDTTDEFEMFTLTPKGIDTAKREARSPDP
jgi:hypothetical protein